MSSDKPDLPTLDRFGADLRAAGRLQERDAQARVAARRRTRRRGRRLVIITAALLAAAPAAIATKAFFSITPDNVDPMRQGAERTRAVIVAAGQDLGAAWQLSAYRDRDRGMCVAIYAQARPAPSQSSSCRPLRRGALNLAFAGSSAGTLIYGAVTPDVERVTITDGRALRRSAQTINPDPEALRPGRLAKNSFRVFVIAAPRSPSLATIRAVGYDKAGHPAAQFPAPR